MARESSTIERVPTGETTINETLKVVRADLKRAEERLLEYTKGERPLREAVDRLRRAERELSGGELSSDEFSDNEIVAMIRDNSSAKERIPSRKVAELFGRRNAKGFSRRLKRMSDEGQIAGSSAEGGFYVPGFDRGRKARETRSQH